MVGKRRLMMELMVRAKGNMAIGIIVITRDAIRQSFCSVEVGKVKFHPEQ